MRVRSVVLRLLSAETLLRLTVGLLLVVAAHARHWRRGKRRRHSWAYRLLFISAATRSFSSFTFSSLRSALSFIKMSIFVFMSRMT